MPDPSSRPSHVRHLLEYVLPMLLAEGDGTEHWHWFRARQLSSLVGQTLRGQARRGGGAVSAAEEAALRDNEILFDWLLRNENRTRQNRYGPEARQEWPWAQAELQRLLAVVEPLL